MSQVFAGDSVNATGGITVPTTTETTGVTGNFLNPPFGNAKAIVMGVLTVVAGTGTTQLALRIRRNPSGENVALSVIATDGVTAGGTYSVPVMAADPIPDGRPVQYAVTVQQTGATGNGSIASANVSTILISG